MSETTSTKSVTPKKLDDSTRLNAGSFDTEADRLIEDVFSDVDSVLDRDFGLPQEPLQPKTVAVKPIRVPPIIMRPLVVPRPSEPAAPEKKDTVTVKATQAQTPDTAGEAFDKFLLGAACASLVATLGLWLWRDEVQQFVQNRLVPTATPTATAPPVPEDPQVSADREFIDYMERSLERINTKLGGGSATQSRTSDRSAANPVPPQATLNIPIDPASIDDIAGSLKEIATVLGRNTTPVARLPQPPNASNPTPPTATASGNNSGNSDSGANSADNTASNNNSSPAPAAAPAAAPVAAAEPSAAEEPEEVAVAESAAVEPEYTQDYSEPQPVWEPEYTEDYSEPQPVWEPEYTEDYSESENYADGEPAPSKPTVASQPEPAEVAAEPAAEAAPSNVHTLMGFLEFGDRSAALFEINGVAQRINIGESVGASGWSLVEVSNQQAVVRRNGEVRSVYVGQQF